MKYRLLIFDFDGTLADTYPWVLGIMGQVAEHFHFEELTGEEVEQLRGSGAGKILQQHQVPFWKFPFIARYVRQEMARQIDQIRPFAGVETVLEQLANRGMRLALVTTNARDNAKQVLGERSFALFQDTAFGVSIFGKQAKYRAILQRSGLPARQALCIGDELRDLDAARKAGIPFGAVAWGYTHLEAFLPLQPDEIFHRLEDIQELVV